MCHYHTAGYKKVSIYNVCIHQSCSNPLTSTCSTGDGWNGSVYTCSGFQNSYLSPTASLGFALCGTNGVEYSTILQLPPGGSFSNSYTVHAINSQYLSLVSASFAVIDSSDYTSSKIQSVDQTGSGSQYTPLYLACQNTAANPTSYSKFYTDQCAKATYPLDCTATPPPILCEMVIACWSLTANQVIAEAGCAFIDFPPSPPEFCCSTPPTPLIPSTIPVCPDIYPYPTDKVTSCVPASPTGNNSSVTGQTQAQITSSYFTPAIRVGFRWPQTPSFYQQIPAGDVSYTVATNIQPGTYIVPTTDIVGFYLPVSFEAPKSNYEVVFGTSSATASRNPYNSTPYGINVGQYCDLNYNYAESQTTANSTCAISDVYGNEMTFTMAPSTKIAGQYCIFDSNQEIIGDCISPPFMPLPTVPPATAGGAWQVGVTPCGSANTPDSFCMNVSFVNGAYSGQIQGTSDSGIGTYTGTLNNTTIPISAIVTDDTYNLPDENGNICLDQSGKMITLAQCPAKGGTPPGGLWYLNHEYLGGGSQFCFRPTNQPPACDTYYPITTSAGTGTNCVLASTINPCWDYTEKTNISYGTPPVACVTPPTTSWPASTMLSDVLNPSETSILPLVPLSANPSVTTGQATRGMTPLEMGLCISIAPPPPTINYQYFLNMYNDVDAMINQVDTDMMNGGSSGIGICQINYSTFSTTYLDNSQVKQYIQACFNFKNYCEENNDNKQNCFNMQNECNAGQTTSPTPPSGYNINFPPTFSNGDYPSFTPGVCGCFDGGMMMFCCTADYPGYYTGSSYLCPPSTTYCDAFGIYSNGNWDVFC